MCDRLAIKCLFPPCEKFFSLQKDLNLNNMFYNFGFVNNQFFSLTSEDYGKENMMIVKRRLYWKYLEFKLNKYLGI